ncbi:hypothetical protein [Synechococcus sp. MIT S9451]|uniref:hypothetical protein n=1 Tax=Synechococcus sp. MIT S9451 TaxID=3082543 RepID=UPI0039B5DB83
MLMATQPTPASVDALLPGAVFLAALSLESVLGPEAGLGVAVGVGRGSLFYLFF